MSLALSFIGGMAKRGMQLNDERRAIDQQIELKTKLSEIENKAAMRRASAARNQKRQDTKENALSTWKALSGPNYDEATVEWAASQTPELQQLMLQQVTDGADFNALVKMNQVTGDDGTSSSQFYLDRDLLFKQKEAEAKTMEERLNQESLKLLNETDPVKIQKHNDNIAKIISIISLSKEKTNQPMKGSDIRQYWKASASQAFTMIGDEKVSKLDVLEGDAWTSPIGDYQQAVDNFETFMTKIGRGDETEVNAFLEMEKGNIDKALSRKFSEYSSRRSSSGEPERDNVNVKYQQVSVDQWRFPQEKNAEWTWMKKVLENANYQTGYSFDLIDNAGNIAYKVLTANGKGWAMSMNSDTPTWTSLK
tara:strand:+ start:71 stop:1165 length:1095 start_codon:yes stop_codon:yes gene_type:complete